jgi:hypothetical protein
MWAISLMTSFMSSKEVRLVMNDLFHVIDEMNMVISDMNHVMNEHFHVALVVLQATVRLAPPTDGA